MQHKIVFVNVGYQILARFSASFIGLVVTLLLARSFGTQGYGDFVKITAFVGLFYLFVDFGLNALYLQKDKENTNFRSFLYSRIVLALGIVVVANLIAYLLPYSDSSDIGFSSLVRFGIVLFSPTIIALAISTSAQAIFQQRLSYKYSTYAGLLGSLATLLSVALFSSFSLPIPIVIVGFVIGAFVTAFFSLVWVGQKLLPIKVDRQFTKELFFASAPLGIMLIFNLIYFRIDAFILSFFRTTAEVGVYGFAYKFFDFFIAIPLFFSNALYPYFLAEQEKKDFQLVIRKYFVVFVASSLLLMGVGIIFAPLFGLVKSDFMASVLPFRILLLSLPLFFITSLLQWLLIAKKQQWYLLKVYGVATAINIVLNLLFIPMYSYIASAIITGGMEAFILVCLLVKMRFLEKYSK